ncbi:MAG: crotonase/enoyl-CoA hydratase family protein [Desulfatibacillum sp.]|nr:crotonase/enoyl-CoA hydratase family protein [Desulfatibacillum sp.]
MSDDILKVEKEGHIAWLVLNNPQKRNIMGHAFFYGLIKIFKELDEDPDVRVVVIRAEGKSFTAGLDLMEAASSLSGGSGADIRENLRKHVLDLQESMNVIEQCRKPVIAAAYSHCIGGGIDMLSACDIRICTKDTVFSIRETRIAIIADLGTLQRMPTLIGHGRFRELALTGRDFSGQEALDMGFVTHLCEDQEALIAKARELANEIAGLAPLTVQGVKDVILHGRDNGVYQGLRYVAQKNAAQLPSEDVVEAVTAFMEKRKPVFKGK